MDMIQDILSNDYLNILSNNSFALSFHQRPKANHIANITHITMVLMFSVKKLISTCACFKAVIMVNTITIIYVMRPNHLIDFLLVATAASVISFTNSAINVHTRIISTATNKFGIYAINCAMRSEITVNHNVSKAILIHTR